MTGSVPLRVLLADDHAIVRKGIREFLEEDGEVTVVAEASGGAEAVRLAGEYRPAVVVLDVQMPGVNGIEATRQIKAAYPEIRVLILTAYDEDPYVFALLRAGADGYVLKNSDPDDLVRAVKTVASGAFVMKHFVPLMTHSWPSWTAVVRALATSEPASASVSAKAARPPSTMNLP